MVKFKRTYRGFNLDRALYLLQTEGTVSLTANSSVSSLTSRHFSDPAEAKI
jgi:hypothetical protein